MDMEAAMKRIPPHSAEAEQAVLGAMLMNKEAITVASWPKTLVVAEALMLTTLFTVEAYSSV